MTFLLCKAGRPSQEFDVPIERLMYFKALLCFLHGIVELIVAKTADGVCLCPLDT